MVSTCLRTAIFALALSWLGMCLTGLKEPKGAVIGATIGADGQIEANPNGDEGDLAFVDRNLIGATIAADGKSQTMQEKSDYKFCWKDTKGRGVGKIPKLCGTGQDRIGLLCYSKCPGPGRGLVQEFAAVMTKDNGTALVLPSALSLKSANKDDAGWSRRRRRRAPTPVPTPASKPIRNEAGWKRFGFDCHTRCPPHMKDQGLFCRDAEYGRGGGYTLWQKKKCQERMGAAIDPKTSKPVGCEKHGLMWYPKCRVGYKNFGCCICRPPRPDCNALGLKNGIDLSCAKKIAIGRPMLGTCPRGQERQLGLCYKTCPKGFSGVGPVCWGKPPPGWFECGLGAVSVKGKCASVIVDQVMSVGSLALSIATAGMSKLAEVPGKLKKSATLIKDWKKLKAAYKSLKKTSPAFESAVKGVKIYKDGAKVNQGLVAVSVAQEIDDDDVSAADIARLAAEIASLVDPSGVTGVISAFAYDKCTRYYL